MYGWAKRSSADRGTQVRVNCHSSVPPNKSLQPKWLSRVHLLPVFVCSRFNDYGNRKE